MTDRSGTTPAPKSATPAAHFKVSLPTDLPGLYVEWIRQQVADCVEKEVTTARRRQAETERLEREGCLERSWCTVENGGEHEEFHAGDSIDLAGGWSCYPTEDRGSDNPVVSLQRDGDRDEERFLIPLTQMAAMLEATKTKEAYLALCRLARTMDA